MRLFIYVLLCLGIVSSFASDTLYLKVEAKSGDNISRWLEKYRIQEGCNVEKFCELNKIESSSFLIQGKEYELPILVFKYNGKNIRSSIDNYDYQLALRIQDYNETLFESKVKDNDFRKDSLIWVPFSYLKCPDELLTQETNTEVKKTQVFPIFGEKYQDVEIKDQSLKGSIYYLVAGHGGPDPGAIGEYQGSQLCEDEYAYDVTLRLAKNLLEHGATVYMIIRDEEDGIRDDAVLACDKKEVCWPNQKIPLNQVTRLQQRVQVINQLYLKHKKLGATHQRAIIIHIDSRSTRSRVDMFFYNYPGSETGKEFATSMHQSVKSNYLKYRKGRGYSGQVKGRELYMLKYSFPTAAFIELGNIRNPEDQKRVVVPRNRQVVADWLTEGILQKK